MKVQPMFLREDILRNVGMHWTDSMGTIQTYLVLIKDGSRADDRLRTFRI